MTETESPTPTHRDELEYIEWEIAQLQERERELKARVAAEADNANT